MFRRLSKLFLLVLIGFATVVAVPRPGWSDLMIMPVRAIFQDRDRTADITLINTSQKEGTFRLEWLNQRQEEDGSYKQLDGPLDPAHDISKMVLFSPRQVFLPPNGRQRVRLSLRKPPDLPEGEYHAHLRMQKIGSSAAISGGKGGGIETIVNINVGFAIPVIIRHGVHDATVTLSDPRFIPVAANGKGKPALMVTLNRSGKHGATGRLKAYWTPPGQEEREIGSLNNVFIFTEINKRTARIMLNETSIPAGTIRVIYEGDGPDKGIVFDEKTFPVGG